MKYNLPPLELNILYEILVTTIDENDCPNVAPMGIKLVNKNEILIQPFIQSNTFENLWIKEECILNYTNDPILFSYGTLFQDELSKESFVTISGSGIPVLKNCINNYSIVKVLEKNKDIQSNRATFRCMIINTKLTPQLFQPYTRAHSLLFEILIHASRIIAFAELQINLEKIPILRESILNNAEIIHRVANDESIYVQLLEKILQKINLKNNKF